MQAEAFTELRLQWDEHPGLMKPLADHEFALGINRLVFHVFAHNPWPDRRPGMTLSGIGTYFQRDQTWWPDAGAWTGYIARCSALLQVGQPVADVAYFTGEELPSRALLPERRSPPLPAGYAADSINPDALLRLATVRDGRLVLPGGANYAALVLPADSTPHSPALDAKLRELEQGGVIVSTSELVSALASRGVAPDLLTSAQEIEWTHRSSPGVDIYFVSNQQATARTAEISLRDNGRQPEIWQPVTGEINLTPPYRSADGRTIVPLHLDPHGSVFVVLRSTTPDGLAVGASLLATATLQSREQARSHNLTSPPTIDPALSSQLSALNFPPSPPQTLDGSWQVTFDPALGGPKESVTFPALTDWSADSTPGIRYYSGPAIYTQTFHWSGSPQGGTRTWLDLGAVANLAHVFVNGVDCGVAWTPPYRVEITRAVRAGSNDLELRVTNTWANRLSGDRAVKAPAAPVTWTTAPAPGSSSLLPAGLLGPVRVLSDTP